jgi:magnesium-protoporphyrin IX monomethyl ester (oxidative) cyclase
MKRVLFLNPPSYEGFDGGAGSRYQARREIRSFWYPTWLAQPAAMVPNSKLIDAPADDTTVEDVMKQIPHFDMVVIHTSTPTFPNDAKICRDIKKLKPSAIVGMVGPHVSVLPQEALMSCPELDFVARKEFDYSCKLIAEGAPYSEVKGISYSKISIRCRMWSMFTSAT